MVDPPTNVSCRRPWCATREKDALAPASAAFPAGARAPFLCLHLRAPAPPGVPWTSGRLAPLLPQGMLHHHRLNRDKLAPSNESRYAPAAKRSRTCWLRDQTVAPTAPGGDVCRQ
jgi:hypothetical protein